MEIAIPFESARVLLVKLYHLQRDSDSFEWAETNELRAMLAELSSSDVFGLLDVTEALPSVSDSDVYRACIYELQGRCNDEVFGRVTEWSQSVVSARRSAAASIMGEFGIDSGSPFVAHSLPLLIALLDDSEPKVVAASLYALGHLGQGSLDAIDSPKFCNDVEVRRARINALLTRPEARAREALIAYSRDEDSHCRDWATFGLGRQSDIDSPDIRDALAARLLDSDENARNEAIVGLAKRQDYRAEQAILQAFEASSVGSLVFEACAMMPNTKFISHLEDFAKSNPKDEDIELALAACRSGKPVDWML